MAEMKEKAKEGYANCIKNTIMKHGKISKETSVKIEEYQYHEQVADWLMELKEFRENKLTSGYLRRVYLKAINDFFAEIEKLSKNTHEIELGDIEEIAKRLNER